MDSYAYLLYFSIKVIKVFKKQDTESHPMSCFLNTFSANTAFTSKTEGDAPCMFSDNHPG
jgi:hypothetical protein